MGDFEHLLEINWNTCIFYKACDGNKVLGIQVLRPSDGQILKARGRKTFNFVFEHLFKIVYLHVKLDYPCVDSINYFLNTYL